MSKIRGTGPSGPAKPALQIRGQHQMMNADQALDIAAQYHSSGDLTSAQVLCNRILEHWPGHPLALNMLGVIAFQLGKLDIAVDYLGKAVDAKPDYADAHFNLGNALKALGRHEEALAPYSRATELNPGHFDAHYNRGNALKALGRLEEALAAYRAALAIKPDFADAHNNSGNVLKAQGRLDEAIAAYRKTVQLQPGYAAAHYNMGVTLQTLEMPEKAVQCYRNALAIKPDLAVAHSNLGTTLTTLGRLEEALSHYQQAIALQPGAATGHNNLAALYERTNKLDQAQACNERALQIAPGDPDSRFLKAVLLRRRGLHREAISAFEALAGAPLSENFALRRLFEIGKLEDALGNYEDAFETFTAANQLHARSAAAAACNKEHYRDRIAHIRSVLNPGWVEAWSTHPGPAPESSPIFMVGFPRSGTTLLDQILDSHPQVQVMEERRSFTAIEAALKAMPGGYPQAISGLGESDILSLRERYFETVDGYFERDPEKAFVDKLPLNIEYLPLIHRLFPGAAIVFSSRHPCDVVLSNFMQYYKLNDAMANFFTLEDAVHIYRQVIDLWVACEETLPLNVHYLKYESLVSEPAGQARKLFEFLDIPWTEAVLEFDRHAANKTIINTPSYEQVTQPIYQRSAGRWHHYRDQLTPFLDDLRPLMEKLGYPAHA